MRVAFLVFLAVAIPHTPGFAGEFSDPACHVRFTYPRRWTIDVDKTARDSTCEIAMEPRNWRELLEKDGDVRLHGLSVEVVERPFAEAVEKDGSFEKRDDEWVVLGRQGIESPATEITGDGWKGVSGISESGCHYEQGGYAGLCPVAVALISDGKRSAIVTGGPSSHEEFERLLKSFRFD